MRIAQEIASVVDWEGLAGWLEIEDTSNIKADCHKEGGEFSVCYRKKLVSKYCDMTGGSAQQVANDFADVLQKRMGNRKMANILRQLDFGGKIYHHCDVISP